MENFRMAIIGLGQRGSGVQDTFRNMGGIEVFALCDELPDRLEESANEYERLNGVRPVTTTNYMDILSMPEVDGVVIATAWEPHIPIAINCMKAGKPCCMEVGGAYSLNDCFDLVRTYEETKTPFMFLENCCYDALELLVTSMVRNGVYGEIVHCSGAYCHDLREEIIYGKEKRHYRLRNYINRNCENYPTHELGPIARLLGINRGNRMVSLVSMASKSAGLEAYVKKHKDKVDPELFDKKFMQGDIITTIIKCAHGETIQISRDTCLPRGSDRAFCVHGTEAISERWNFMKDGGNWRSLKDDAFKKYEAEVWSTMTEQDRLLGHGGMDGVEFRQFVDCVRNGKEMPIDVYDAAAWMSISCLTETSIAQGGAPQGIPDFTHGEWLRRPLKDVLPFPDVRKK